MLTNSCRHRLCLYKWHVYSYTSQLCFFLTFYFRIMENTEELCEQLLLNLKYYAGLFMQKMSIFYGIQNILNEILLLIKLLYQSNLTICDKLILTCMHVFFKLHKIYIQWYSFDCKQYFHFIPLFIF